MKKIFCLFCVLFLSTGVYAQTLYVENGVAFSSLKGLYDETLCKYQMSAGVYYLNRNWSFLSSSLGFLQKGGKYTYWYAESINQRYRCHHSEVVKYITANTLYNVKYDWENVMLYGGIGPQLAINVGDNEIADYDRVKRVNYSLKTIIGINYHLNSCLIGGSISYLPTLGHIFQNRSGNDKTIMVSLFVGYNL